MYFLAKLCRLCVTTDGDLRNINSFDCDSIRFSEKLKTCTKMVLEVDPWSSYLCYTCIKKLRVSYEFHVMCRKSTSVLKKYISELLSEQESEPPENFENADLKVSIKKLLPKRGPAHQVARKQRTYVSKVVRCSLLKDLLTKIEDDKKQQQLNTKRRKHKQPNNLRDLINFTKRYNYGYKLDENKIENINFECTPLDRLEDFVESYFRINFSCFHDNITSVLEQTEELFDDSDFEEMVNIPCEEQPVKFEEVIIEPDINIKKEIFDDEDEENDYDMSYENYALENPRTKIEVKVEPDIPNISQDGLYLGHTEYMSQDQGCSSTSKRSNSEIYPTLCQSLSQDHQSSLNLLQEFTEQRFKKRRAFSPNSYRCRTRNHPFISPQLKHQFLNQDFSCGVCKRKFKSQGYLQAHYSKMKHNPVGR